MNSFHVLPFVEIVLPRCGQLFDWLKAPGVAGVQTQNTSGIRYSQLHLQVGLASSRESESSRRVYQNVIKR